jgi:hypothetical protein
MNLTWSSVAFAQDAVTLVSGVANANFFAFRSRRATGAHRAAAGVLGLLSAGSALQAWLLASTLAGDGWAEVIARTPTLAGNLAVLALIVWGHRR